MTCNNQHDVHTPVGIIPATCQLDAEHYGDHMASQTVTIESGQEPRLLVWRNTSDTSEDQTVMDLLEAEISGFVDHHVEEYARTLREGDVPGANALITSIFNLPAPMPAALYGELLGRVAAGLVQDA